MTRWPGVWRSWPRSILTSSGARSSALPRASQRTCPNSSKPPPCQHFSSTEQVRSPPSHHQNLILFDLICRSAARQLPPADRPAGRGFLRQRPGVFPGRTRSHPEQGRYPNHHQVRYKAMLQSAYTYRDHLRGPAVNSQDSDED